MQLSYFPHTCVKGVRNQKRIAIRHRRGVFMTKEKNVAEQIQNEEIIQPQETQENSQESPEVLQQQEEIVSDKEYNFRKLEESKRQLEGKVQDLESVIKKIATDPEPSQETPPPEDYLGLGDEDIAEGRHLKRVTQELDMLKKQMHNQQLQAVPDRLNAKFSDFNEVVSKENIEKLKQTEPELYSSIISGPDLYARGVSAYKTLKAMGFVDNSYQSQKEQVQKNHNRPMSTQAIKGAGALSEQNIFAGGLTPELKKQLQREMAEASKAR